MSPGPNEGIQQSGGATFINSGAMAVGRGARVSQGAVPTPEQALATLRDLLAAHRAELPDASRIQARGELEELADELGGDQPDRSRVATALAAFASAVSSVSALTSGVDTLRQTLEHIGL